ncbi:MAG: zinc ABC transporter substrate-binding protein [Neisseria sp.]|nr:zinc ABC transporter substrate-binding protein [Neisseria sp.]
MFLSAGLWAQGLPVTASFSIIGDVAREIGGERVTVTNIIGANQDAHVYRITPQDLRTIRASKLVLMNGLGLESAEFERAVKSAKIPFALASHGIKARAAEEEHNEHDHHRHDHGAYDPHVWHDPVLMQTYAQNIADALTQADPAGKDYYRAQLNRYQQKLRELDTWAQKQFAGISENQRKVLTAHDAFGYLGARYRITFIAPQGLSEDSEPSAKAVAAIIRQVKKDRIRAVFMENIKNPRLVDQLARETGLNVAGKLYSDALSAPNGGAATYLDMMRHNISALSKAMQQ